MELSQVFRKWVLLCPSRSTRPHCIGFKILNFDCCMISSDTKTLSTIEPGFEVVDVEINLCVYINRGSLILHLNVNFQIYKYFQRINWTWRRSSERLLCAYKPDVSHKPFATNAELSNRSCLLF